MLADNRPVVVMFGLGVMQQAGSTQLVKALADVALLLGGSIMPLRGQANAQGAADLGLACEYLPGYAHITDAQARQKWEAAWDCRLPEAPGMNAVEMVRGCATGGIKTLLIFGENVALSAPSSQESLAALDKAEFVAISELYLTETAQLADVVFPACSFLEKDGTLTNIERRVQRVRGTIEPVGESRSDLDTIADLASALGSQMARKPADVMAEIAANVTLYADVSYAALDKSWGVPWPTNGARPKLAPTPGGQARGAEDGEFSLIASRINFPQHTGTTCARAPILVREYPEAFVEISERDAENLRLRPGRMVRISSGSGVLTRPLRLSADVPDGCVHVPHFFGGDSPNALASYESDPISGVPVYKGCAVKVEEAK